jgi:hypothetical protein
MQSQPALLCLLGCVLQDTRFSLALNTDSVPAVLLCGCCQMQDHAGLLYIGAALI